MAPISPSSLNQSVVKRILLSIDALNEAESLSNSDSQSSFNLMRSVLMADLSLELAAPTICEVLELPLTNSQKGKTPYLGEYISAIQNHFKLLKNVDYLSNRIRGLHDNRGKVQHSGLSFDRDSTRRMCEDAREYINFVFLETFGLALEHVNVSLSIENEEVRHHISSAIEKRTAGQHYEAAQDLAIAYAKSEDFLLGRAIDITGLTREEASKIKQYLIVTGVHESLNNRAFRPDIDSDVRSAIERIANIIHLQQLGLSNSEIAILANKLPGVARAPFSSVYFTLGNPIQYSDVEISNLTDIVIKVIWRMQNLIISEV
jgi:hypothetical protein